MYEGVFALTLLQVVPLKSAFFYLFLACANFFFQCCEEHFKVAHKFMHRDLEQSRSLCTVPIDRILSVKNVRAWVSMDFKYNKFSAPRTIEKMKILGAVLELPAKKHCKSSPLAKSAMLFSWQLQNCSQDFDSFNCPGC